MAVVAPGSQYSRNTAMMIAVIALAAGGWFLYDGWMGEKFQRENIDWSLRADDVSNWVAFSGRLKNPKSAADRLVRAKLSSDGRSLVDKHGGVSPAPEALQRGLLEELNDLLRRPDFYDRSVLAGAAFGEETQKFIDLGEPKEHEVVIRNRLILADLYPDTIAGGNWRRGEPNASLKFNRYWGPLACLLVALYFVVSAVRIPKQHVVLDDNGLLVAGRGLIGFDQIKKIDKRFFDKEGYFVVTYEQDGTSKDVRLSERKYDNLRAVLDALVARVMPGEADGASDDATPEKQA